MASGNKDMGSYDTQPREGKDVKDTSQLKAGAREVYQTGTNTLKRQVTGKPAFGKGGVKGFA